MSPLLKRIVIAGLSFSALAIIILVWIISARSPQLASEPESLAPSDNAALSPEGDGPIAYEDLEWRTNSQGKKWALSSDEADFVVSTKDDGGIRFWEGNITPLKVAPGMTQHMKIVVSSPSGIESVTAMIQTDNGTTTVELKKTGVLAARDLDERHGLYTVDKDNTLAINTAEEAAAYRLALAQAEEGKGPINTALAASGEREVFEGSWEVKDTSVRDYITIFLARDSSGREKTNTLSWSDPCNNSGQEGVFWPNGGNATLTDNCSLASTYGVDNGNLTITQNGVLNLNSGAILAFNPGKQITLNDGAKINIGANASIQKKYLFAVDNDGDHYAASGQRWLSSSPTAIAQEDSGWKAKLLAFFKAANAQTGNVFRQYTLVSTTDDCYDSNANANPGQDLYFSSDRGDGSFDYDCSGTVTSNTTHRCLGDMIDYSKGSGLYFYTQAPGVIPEFICQSDLDCESTFNGGGTCISNRCCTTADGGDFSVFGCANSDIEPYVLPEDCGSAYGFKGTLQVFTNSACSSYDPRLVYTTQQVECR